MVRCLTGEDVARLAEELAAYEAGLTGKTGLTLREIAVRAIGVSDDDLTAAIAKHKAAAVPITAGGGVVTNFSQAVAGILIYLGVDAFPTMETDAAGIAEAVERGADIVFFADDARFVAVNLPKIRVIDNAEATAKGYVTALDAMAGGLKGRRVLVIGGAGQVGWSAVLALKGKGAEVAANDIDNDRMKSLAVGNGVTVETDLKEALGRYTIYFDASTAANIIEARHIKPETLVAAPGMPLGLTDEARSLVGERLLNDVLEIGVSAMLVQASCI